MKQLEKDSFKIKTFHAEDFFNHYPHKKQRPKVGNTIQARPYVKQSEESKHDFALNYDEWKEITTSYAEVMSESIFEGHSYAFISIIGEMRLKKQKWTKNYDLVNWGKTLQQYVDKYDCTWKEAQQLIKEDEEPNLILYDNRHSRDYIVKLYWEKTRGCNFKWKTFWKYSMSTAIKQKIHKKLKTDIFFINQLPETTSIMIRTKKF